MHRILFAAKRIYWRTVKVGRALLAYSGLTPARFDLLYLLVQRRRHDVRQCEIWKELGVTPIVVSRMLAALEEIGLVERDIDEDDQRMRLVTLTREGRKLMKRVMRDLIRKGVVKAMIQKAFARSGEDLSEARRLAREARWPHKSDNEHVIRVTHRCHRELLAHVEQNAVVLKGLGDTAARLYRWHPVRDFERIEGPNDL